MLYITGLRLSNILLVTFDHVDELFKYQEMHIKLIKRGPVRHKIVITDDDFFILKSIEDKIRFLRDYSEKYSPFSKKTYLISHFYKPHESLTVRNLLKSLRPIFEKTSTMVRKHIRSHFFRISRVSDLMENNDIEQVSRVMGHSSIKSTKVYNRTEINWFVKANLAHTCLGCCVLSS